MVNRIWSSFGVRHQASTDCEFKMLISDLPPSSMVPDISSSSKVVEGFLVQAINVANGSRSIRLVARLPMNGIDEISQFGL